MVGHELVVFAIFFFVLFLMMQLFNEFSILSWNIRGVVNSQGKRNYRDLVYKYQLSLFVILETHALFARVEKLWASLGYFLAVIVESQGHAGGIWIL
jgi:hypothetical protein